MASNTELPAYLKEAMYRLEIRAASAAFRTILPSDHQLFAAREAMVEAIKRYAAESREEPAPLRDNRSGSSGPRDL